MKKLMNQRWFIALVFMVLYKPAMFSQMPALHTFDTISNVFKVMVIAVLGVVRLLLPKSVAVLCRNSFL